MIISIFELIVRAELYNKSNDKLYDDTDERATAGNF